MKKNRLYVLPLAAVLSVSMASMGMAAEAAPAADEEPAAAQTLTTVTVDGVEVAAEDAGNFEGEAVETDTVAPGQISSLTLFDAFPYRTALYVKDGEIADDMSVTAAVVGGSYDGTAADGISVTSYTDDFSAIIVDGSEYTVSNSVISQPTESEGKKTNDFAGLGAAIVNTDGSILTIEDSTVDTAGVAKPALFSDNGAVAIVKNSELTSMGGTVYEGYISNADQLMMVCPPWVLGLNDAVANTRTTTMMGKYTTGVYVDSTVYANGWGALSTDSDASYSCWQHLVTVNTDVDVPNSGYGAYAVSEAVEDYYGTSMDVATYAVIMTGGAATFESYTGGQEIEVVQYNDDTQYDPEYQFVTVDWDGDSGLPVIDDGDVVAVVKSDAVADGEVVYSEINSDNFGFMCHSNLENGWNVVKIIDGTTLNTGDAAFLVKKVSADIYVDNASVNSENGVLLQIIDNDDDYVGPDMSFTWGIDDPSIGRTVGTTSMDDLMAGNPCHFPTFRESITEPAGWSYEWTEADMGVTAATLNTTGDSGWQVNLNLTNTSITGDVWNSSGYVTENGGSALTVNMGENAELTGIISAGAFKHTIQDDESLFVEDDSIDAGGYYEALVGNAYGEANGTAADWKNADYMGHVDNTQYANGYNKVVVNLEDNAVWNVTGTCMLDELNIGADAQIAAEGTITMTVDGKEVQIEAGQQYTGAIVITVE